jgi:hypothetical protein
VIVIKSALDCLSYIYYSAIMSKRIRQPNVLIGGWPAEMRATTAATYCDEPSVDAFLLKVKQGIYPKPCRHQGILPKWHRAKLDGAIALRHGLLPVGGLVAEDVTELI